MYAYNYFPALLYLLFTFILILSPRQHKRKAIVFVGACLIFCIMIFYNHYLYKVPAEENRIETVVRLQDRVLITSSNYVLVF